MLPRPHISQNNLHTTIGSIIQHTPHLPILMFNIIQITFLKFSRIHLLRELVPPKPDSILIQQTNPFQKETISKSGLVLMVVLRPQNIMHVPHTQREVFFGISVQIGGVHTVCVFANHVVVACVDAMEVGEKGVDAVVVK